MTEEALRKLALQVRNWGRWGPQDEIGTLNYITPEKIAQACYAFLLVAPPLPVTQGVGTPINPHALK